jgi:hypothetical protein
MNIENVVIVIAVLDLRQNPDKISLLVSNRGNEE